MKHPIGDCMKRHWHYEKGTGWVVDNLVKFNEDLEQTVQRILRTKDIPRKQMSQIYTDLFYLMLLVDDA